MNRLKRYRSWILIAVLIVIIGILYFPTLMSYFISDDFTYVAWTFFNAKAMLEGLYWRRWLVESIDPRQFRPVGLILLFADYLIWGTNAFGYHLTDMILHTLSSILVFLIVRQLRCGRTETLAATGLFAIQPTHSGAVSWVAAACYDVLGGFLALTSFLFFIVYRRRKQTWHYAVSWIAFVLALLTKEIAITFPAAILVYDLLFNFSRPFRVGRWLRRHLPFWISVGIYLIYRFFVHSNFGYKGLNITAQDLQQWITGTLINMANPFIADWSNEAFWIVLGLCALVIIAYHSRREVLLGGAWVLITYFPVIGAVTGPSARSFYLASFGLVLILASVLVRPTQHSNPRTRSIGATVLILVALAYGTSLFTQNQILQRASQVAQTIPSRVKTLHPTFPSEARLIFTGVPYSTPEGVLIYASGFVDSMALTYGTRDLQISKSEKFPIWFDKLDRTYMFQVDHRQVTERTDVVQALQARARCEDYAAPLLTWVFSEDTLNWQSWNQLSGFGIHDGILVMQSDGDDPIMASPPIDVPAIAVGEIQITMRVRAAQPILRGELYWLASGQRDFSPGLKSAFQVLADGEWHTYHVDIGKSGMLLIGDRIMQIRLDPADAPADIAIRSIRIFTHCSSLQGEHCVCTSQQLGKLPAKGFRI